MAAASLAGLGVGAWLKLRGPEPVRLTLTPVVREVLTDPGSPAAGPASGSGQRPDVTVVVFTDYRCAICRLNDGALHSLLASDPGVRILFKDWPIFGEASTAAARVALAAHRQGAYVTAHRALMSASGRLDPPRIANILAEAGLDAPRLTADLQSHGPAIDTQLARHARQAFALGLQGTPGYIVGPDLVQGGLGRSALAAAVRRARRHGPLTP